jgi:hypothetical protein
VRTLETMGGNMSSDRLTEGQQELWELLRPDLAEPDGDQTLAEARYLAITTFGHLCEMDGWDPPTEAEIVAALRAAGFTEGEIAEALTAGPGSPNRWSVKLHPQD